MPYTARKEGDQYCVYKKDGGAKVGCTDGNKEALHKYLAALHLNANESINEEQKGLWANIRAKRARGEKPARKGSEAYKDAVAAAKKINAQEITICDSCAVALLEAIRTTKQELTEAEYQGRTVKLGKPMQGDVKKFKVYVKNPKGNVVKVNFGQKGMSIKKSDPARRRSFRARHNCDNPGPRDKARYWSCRKW
jgi:hypothetical protein